MSKAFYHSITQIYGDSVELIRNLPPLHSTVETYMRESPKVQRNDKCSCGSGIKYKKCCIKKLTHANN